MEMAHTDENLMLAVRSGDLEKLGVLFERYHRKLFDFFAKLTGSRSVAEDLVQDVFFRILRYRNTFQNDSYFKAWMFHIARNARIDYFRKHPLDTAAPDESTWEIRSTTGLPGQEFEQEQQRALLECALQKLPVEKREVLILSRYQDMKYEQIAELLDCEVSTVKVRVFRAIRELRDIYFTLTKEKQPCNVKRSVNNLRIM